MTPPRAYRIAIRAWVDDTPPQVRLGVYLIVIGSLVTWALLVGLVVGGAIG